MAKCNSISYFIIQSWKVTNHIHLNADKNIHEYGRIVGIKQENQNICSPGFGVNKALFENIQVLWLQKIQEVKIRFNNGKSKILFTTII